MNVVESDVPSGSMLSRDVIEHAYFRDSYRAPLSRRDLGIVDVFFAIFAHHPLWMKLLLIVRNKIAAFAGLDAPTASEILHVKSSTSRSRTAMSSVKRSASGPFSRSARMQSSPDAITSTWIFRLSVIKVPDGDRSSVVVSTICTVHNLFGKLYLFFVVPFHRWSAFGS